MISETSPLFIRSKPLIGERGVEILSRAHIAVFGIGGVGSYALEALVRAGVGTLTAVDSDTVAKSNLNRQLIATTDTVGMDKVSAAMRRAMLISPEINFVPLKLFVTEESLIPLDFSAFSAVIDAVDNVSAKLAIITRAKLANVPVVSVMGAGNKLDPCAFKVADIEKTSVCPLAKVMRRECKKRGLTHVRAVYSEELPAVNGTQNDDGDSVRTLVPCSISCVPAAAGLAAAAEVVRILLQ